MMITARDVSYRNTDYYVNGEKIATAFSRECRDLNRIRIYENGQPRYRLDESSRVEWIMRRYLLHISLIFQLLKNPTYDVYDGERKVGSSWEKWFKALRTFHINGDMYRTFTHKNETFSLHKNGEQVALYIKTPEKFFSTTSVPRSYSVLYESTEPLWIIYLFCVFEDLCWFADSDNGGTKKILVFRDPYESYTLWTPCG